MRSVLWGLNAIVMAVFTGVCLDQHDWGWAFGAGIASAACSWCSVLEIGK